MTDDRRTEARSTRETLAVMELLVDQLKDVTAGLAATVQEARSRLTTDDDGGGVRDRS